MIIEAHAKVNLSLEVLGERSDGYHALRSIILPISLSDTLEIIESPSLTCDSGFADDLCLKAARILDPNRGATIHVSKRIPVGGGLGGGSADAAATLIALNEIWGLHRSRDELAKIGSLVGSDVPALVLGGAVLMEGRGEVVTRLLGIPALDLVLVNPGVFSSTREVYANCRSRAALDDDARVCKLVQAMSNGDLCGVSELMTNDLQDPAISLHPEIRVAFEALQSHGVVGALMSGSGSTVFGIVENAAQGLDISRNLGKAGFWAQSVRTMP